MGSSEVLSLNDSAPHSDKKEDEMNDVPDPDEDDLDDLDDMLDEFSSTSINQNQNFRPKFTTEIPTEGKPVSTSDDIETDRFARELQEQMATFVGSMDESPEIKHELESMMKQLESSTKPGPTSQRGADSHKSEESFQETIRKTMERIQASDNQAGVAAHSEDSDDILAKMLSDIHHDEFPGDGDEEGFSKMLLGMMEQLTNKEILYDPMKELQGKFPPWIEKHRATTKPEDMMRYDKQQRLVHEIVQKFEERDYSDSRAADREFIVDRMQRMQAAGSPPADLVGDMDAMEALNNVNSSCPQQ